MVPRKSKSRETQEVAFEPTKVNKRKTIAKTAEPSMAFSAPTINRAKRYKNGLLNLESTPSHLVSIVQRNSIESSLLRLPPEIRTLIWRFTLGGQLVLLPVKQHEGQGGAVRYEEDRKIDIRSYRWLYSEQFQEERQQERLPSAFHLPEVCRQIYSETALTAYTHSVFTFGSEFKRCRNGIMRLKAVQRRAISSIEPNFKVLGYCIRNEELAEHTVPYTPSKSFKQNSFPNLKTIIINRLAFNYVQRHFFPGRGANMSEDDRKQWLTQILKRREGDSIEVEFKRS